MGHGLPISEGGGKVPAKTFTRTIHVGTTALAKECGLLASEVSRLYKLGLTDDQIREKGRQRAQKKAEKEAKKWGLPKPVVVTPKPTPTGYVPERRLVKVNGKWVKAEPTTITPAADSPAPTLAPTAHRVGLVDVDADEALEYEANYHQAIGERNQRESLDAAKLRRARALADGTEIMNLERIGRLVDVEHIRNWGTRFLVAARDEMLKAPEELRDTLAGETDPVKCGEIVREWVGRVLEKLQKCEELWTVKAVVGEDERAA